MFNTVEDIEQIHNYDDELVTIRIFSKSHETLSSGVSDAALEKTSRTIEGSNSSLEESNALKKKYLLLITKVYLYFYFSENI